MFLWWFIYLFISLFIYSPVNYEVAFEMQTLQSGTLSSINMKTVTSLAEAFLMHPEEHMAWLNKINDDFQLLKTHLLFMLMQSFIMMKNGVFSFFTLIDNWFIYFFCFNGCDPLSFWTLYTCLAHTVF